MASPFSGALQLTDLDDFIGPSQVGRPGRPCWGKPVIACFFSGTRPHPRGFLTQGLWRSARFLINRETEAREGRAFLPGYNAKDVQND